MLRRTILWTCLFFLMDPGHDAVRSAEFTGAGDGTSFSDPANWDIGAVPWGMDASIPGGMTVNHDLDGMLSQLTSLNLGGELHIANPNGSAIDQFEILGPTELTGSLTTSNMRLTSTGVDLVDGPRQLIAGTNSELRLSPTNLVGADSRATLLRADGENALLDLSAVQQFFPGTNWDTDVQATNGGNLDLSNITQIVSGSADFLANGTDSRINVSSLTEYSPTNSYQARIQALNGGSFVAPQLQRLEGVSVSVTGGGTFVSPALQQLNGGDVVVDGADSSVDFTQLQELRTGSLTARNSAVVDLSNNSVDLQETSLVARDRGEIRLPGSFTTFQGSADRANMLQADGEQTVLDLSSVQQFAAGTNWDTDVQALNGGQVDLSNVPQIVSGSADFLVRGTNSRIDVSSLTEYFPTNGYQPRIQVRDGGSFDAPQLQRLEGVSVSVDGADSSVDFSQLQELRTGSLTANNGAVVDLSNNTVNLDETSLTVSNRAEIRLPGSLTSYQGSSDQPNLLQADGEQTELDLSSVQQFAAGTNWDTDVQATNGGQIDLSNVPQIVSGSADFLARGANSRIDVSSLTEYLPTNSYQPRIQALDGASFVAPQLQRLEGVSVSVTEGGSLVSPALQQLNGGDVVVDGINSSVDFSQLQELRTGSLTANNGAVVDLSNNTVDLHETSLIASDRGEIRLPGSFATFQGASDRPNMLQADGAQTVLDLSSVQQFAAGDNWDTDVQAINGGQIDLSNVPQIVSGSADFLARGTNSRIDLSSLTEYIPTNGYQPRIQVIDGGSFISPQLQRLEGVSVSADGAESSVDFSQLQELRTGSLTANNGAIFDLSNNSLNLDETSLTVSNRAEIRLPGSLTSYQGSSDQPNLLQADGEQTELDLSSVQQFVPGNSWDTDVQATNGGRIDLSNVAQIVSGSADFLARGANSRIDVSSLTEYMPTNGYQARIQALDGASFVAPQLQRLEGVSVSVTEGGSLVSPALQQLNGGDVVVDGINSSVDFSQLQELRTGSLTASNGAVVDLSSNTIDLHETSLIASDRGEIRLPGNLASFQGSSVRPNMLQADGAQTVLDLSSVQQFAAGDNWDTDVQAINGGQVDLSNVPQIVSGSADFLARGANSRIDVSSLTEYLPTNGYQPRIQVRNGGSFIAPQLQRLEGVSVSVDGADSSVDFSQLQVLRTGSLTADNGAVVDLSNNSINLDESSLTVRNRGEVRLPGSFASYQGSSEQPNMLQADGDQTLLNLSSVQQFLPGNNWDTNVQAINGGRVDLSGVAQVASGSADFLARGANSLIDVSSLNVYAPTNHLHARIQVSEGAAFRAGDLSLTGVAVQVTDRNSVLETSGGLQLDETSSLQVSNQGQLRLNGSLAYRTQEEDNMQLDTGQVHILGNVTVARTLEVAGEDRGLNGATAENFGIGQLTIGDNSGQTVTQLVDSFSNGNQVDGQSEAIYLYGIDRQNGLDIASGSMLILNGINAYAFDQAADQQVHLNALIPLDQPRITLEGGGILQREVVLWAWNTGNGQFKKDNFSHPVYASFTLGAGDDAIFDQGNGDYEVEFISDEQTNSVTVGNDMVSFGLGGNTYSNHGLFSDFAISVGTNPGDDGSLTINEGTLEGRDAVIASDANSEGTLVAGTGGGIVLEKSLELGAGDASVEVGSESTIVIGTETEPANPGAVTLYGDGSLVGGGVVDGELVSHAATIVSQIEGNDSRRLSVTGSAELSGTLRLDVQRGTDLIYGNELNLLTVAGDLIGRFEMIENSLISADLALAVTYDENSVMATAALPGDANLDGTVDVVDLNTIGTHWQSDLRGWVDGDFDGNGFVDAVDLNILGVNWLRSTADAAPVPEPVGISLLALLVLTWWLRKGLG